MVSSSYRADDNEFANLQSVCDELFGEENLIGTFVVNAAPNARDYGHLGKMHEYALFYAKNIEVTRTFLIPDDAKKFRFEDTVGGFNVHPLYNSNEAFTSKNRQNLFYPFYLFPRRTTDDVFFYIGLTPSNEAIEIYPPKSLRGGVQFVWRWGKEKASTELNREIIGYKTEDGEYRIVQKMRHNAKLIRSILSDTEFATRNGTAEIEALFKGKVYPFPKPVALLQRFMQSGVGPDGIVLDFFAGSGTTAHAVLYLNRRDGGHRKFVLIQLPEPTGREDYATIADITKERVRRVIKKLNDEDAGKLDLEDVKNQDRGFRVFKLAESNFKPWNADTPKDAEALARQIELHIDHVREGRRADDLLYEILLKSGFPLATPVEALTLGGKKVHSVANGALFICLERKLTLELIRAMAEKKPERVVCLDEGFTGNDQLKANALQTFKTKGVTSFKTV